MSMPYNRLNRFVSLACLLLLGACASVPVVDDSTEGFAFVVIGDTPYDTIDRALIQTSIPLIKAKDVPFVIHVGDTKAGGALCDDGPDNEFADLVSKLNPIPVFYTPGDNEWTDCDRNRAPNSDKPYSELARLTLLRHRFFAHAPTQTSSFDYGQQPEQIENATWRYDHVRFMTLDIVGTNNGRSQVLGDDLEVAGAAADARDTANLNWIHAVFAKAKAERARAVIISMQADMTDVPSQYVRLPCHGVRIENTTSCDAFMSFRAAIAKEAKAFGKPVLVINGDTEPFTFDQTFAGDEVANLYRINAAGDAHTNANGETSGVRDMTYVRVQLGTKPMFTAIGLNGHVPNQ